MKIPFHKLLILLILTGLPAGISVKATLINEQDKTKQAKEKPLKIFTLGDSNGALPFGWVNQLKEIGPDEMLEEKYKGGMERVTKLNEQLLRIAKEEKVYFINTCQILYPVFKNLTSDGVHLNADGQKIIALIIQENLKIFSGSRILKHID
jgi:hypothetical protein